MAVNAANTKASLNDLLKDVYGDKLDNLRPDFGVLTNKIAFREAKKTGRDYVEAVHLTHEHSVTYGAGLQTLANIVPSIVDDAKIRGSAMTLRTAFSYDAAANMASDKGSFIDATKFKFQNLMESATYRLELQMLYGSSELGVVASANDGADTIVINAATWAPGIWAAAEGAPVSIYTAGGVLRVTTAVVAVAADTRTLTLTASTDLSAVIAGDRVVFAGSFGNEMVGLRSISAAGTGSGPASLYGISSASYSMWQGNVSAVGAANLTLKKIYDGLVPAVGKGLMEDVVVLVSPATFSTLANDEAALRRYTAKTSKGDRGVDSIQFVGANGSIEILIHPMVREQEAIAFPIKRAERVGASDLSFKTPGYGSDEMFHQLPDQTGFECRLYSEQSIFLPAPAKCVLFTGISNV